MAHFSVCRQHRTGAALLGWFLVLFFPSSSYQKQIEKAVLRFAPAAGTRLDYNINALATVSGKNLLGKDLSLTAVSQGDLHFAVQASALDTLRARLTSRGIEIRVQLPDRTLTEILKTRDNQALEVSFNRTGRIEEIRNAAALSPGKILNFSLPQILTDYFPVLPAESVSPGDGWSENRRISVPFQGFDLNVHLKTDYVLNEIVSLAEGRLGLISVVFSVAVSGMQKLGDSVGVFEGRGTGTDFLNFLVGRGVFTEYKIDFKTDAAFVVKRGKERLFEWPFAFSVFAYITLTNRAGF
jgi:hypothetical protein